MEFQISGRNLTVSDRFRDYINEKAEKIEKLAEKPQSLEAKITQDGHSKSETSMVVELTVRGKGPVIRAEAHSSDKFAAFDLAYAKLLERLRRAADRRKIHHRGHHAPVPVHAATADLDPLATGPAAESGSAGSPQDAASEAPVLIRRKVFPAVAMSVDDAVDAMELVGHDFYVFRDEETGHNAVVYRRAGMSYGMLTLLDAESEVGRDQMREYRAG